MKRLICAVAFLSIVSCKVHNIAKKEEAIGKTKIQILELGYPFKCTWDKEGRYALTDRTKQGREAFIFERDTCVEYIAETKSKRIVKYKR